ncbi:hypothetical protein AAKU67_004503 [Oxalobacteraceae bacterium GrIS 2.11]
MAKVKQKISGGFPALSTLFPNRLSRTNFLKAEVRGNNFVDFNLVRSAEIYWIRHRNLIAVNPQS